MHVLSSALANIVDPDQKPADLDLQCFHKKRINPGSAGQVLVKKASYIPVIYSLLNQHVEGARKMNSYAGRSSLARTIYHRMITDEQHRQDSHSYVRYIHVLC